MAMILVSKNNIPIFEKQFHETLLIIGRDKLYWHFYPSEEGFWITDINGEARKLEEANVSGPQQFALIFTRWGYEVRGVLPDWSLSIDDVTLPHGFYDTFEVAWRTLKVGYLGYEFLFTFDSENIEQITASLPKPIY